MERWWEVERERERGQKGNEEISRGSKIERKWKSSRIGKR